MIKQPVVKQQAHAIWRGGLKDGSGSFRSGTVNGDYSFASRFEGREGSTPEELLAAAHAACFSMALSLFLGKQGYTAEAIRTTATVHLHPEQLAIAFVELETEAEVPRLRESEFRQAARLAKENCPISKALGAVQVVLKAARLIPMPAQCA